MTEHLTIIALLQVGHEMLSPMNIQAAAGPRRLWPCVNVHFRYRRIFVFGGLPISLSSRICIPHPKTDFTENEKTK